MGKTLIWFIAMLIVIGGFGSSQLMDSGDRADSTPMKTTYEDQPAPPYTVSTLDTTGLRGQFTENLGQMGEGGGRFYALGSPVSVALGVGWMAFDIRDVTSTGEGTLVKVELVGANPIEPAGVGTTGRSDSFFKGSDESCWYRGAQSYEEVLYQDLWDGMDLRFYFTEDKVVARHQTSRGLPGDIACIIDDWNVAILA